MTELYDGPTVDELHDRMVRLDENTPTPEELAALPEEERQERISEIHGKSRELRNDVTELFTHVVDVLSGDLDYE